MFRSAEIATVVGAAVVLAACGTTAPETQRDEPAATTSSSAPQTSPSTTTAPTTEPSATTTSTVVDLTQELVGDWFACEFVETPGEAPTDDCATLDDDGLRFDSAGLLVSIERVGGTERNCLFDNPGRCFESDLEEIEISGELLGGWALDGTTIAVGTADCDGTVEWERTQSYSIFRPGDANGCDLLRIDSNASDQAEAGGVYFGRYEGTSVLVEG